MTNRNIPDESHGPDIRLGKIGCYQHYSGVKTGFQNSCCCCSPCGYDKFYDASVGMGTHCWRCHPQFLTGKFTPSNTGVSCCKTVTDVVEAVVTQGSPTTIVDYDIALGSGNTWTWSLTNTSGVSNTGCFWRLQCSNQGIDNYYNIDHFNVTSLEPPNVSISGIVGMLGCTGVVTFGSYDRKPVAYQSRTGVFSPTDSLKVDATGYMTNATFVIESGGSLQEVTQDIGNFPQSCSGLPRYLCIRQYRGSSDPHDKVEFNWDSGFSPYHLPYEKGIVYGKWSYTPPNTGNLTESIFVVENYSGEYPTSNHYSYEFRTNFVPQQGEVGNGFPQYESGTPTSLSWNMNSEFWSGIPLDTDDCSCKLSKKYNSGGQNIWIRGGKCSPWKYYCGDNRCVPETLCGIINRSGVAYRNMSWQWDQSCKCWQQTSSGVDVGGSGYDENISIYLNPEGSGQYQSDCIISTSNAAAYGIGTQRVSSLGKIPTINLNGSGWNLVAFPDFGEGCGFQNGSCTTATPCVNNCGSNPSQLNLFISGYGYEDPGDPYGTPDICTADVDMVYYETITIESNSVVRECEYRGYIYENCSGETPPYFNEVEFILKDGVLQINQNGLFAYNISLDESCDPYYATGVTFEPDGGGCLFNDCPSILFITQYTAEITEV